MLRREETISRVRVLDVIAHEPAYVLLAQQATRPDGKQRTITQKVCVPDAAVFARLAAEVNKGDEIDAVIITEWSKQGYSTHLADFHTMPSQSSDRTLLPSTAAKAS